MPRKKTNAEFIRDAVKVHGDRYNYDRTRYDGVTCPVEIECKTHGVFNQKPSEHLAGNGCQKCGLERRVATIKKIKGVTTEDLIKRSQQTHGDRYDYSKAEYVKYGEPVDIICKTHGLFSQLFHNHIRGAGCPHCANERLSEGKKLKLEDFILRSDKVHCGFYDYSNSNITGAHSKITVTCPEHGDFLTTPSRHMSGVGCPECGLLKLSRRFSMGKEEFIRRAKDIHGDKYTYEEVDYINTNTPVRIRCGEHGIFHQRPGSHLRGSGCNDCSNTLNQREYRDVHKTTNLYLFEIITPDMEHQFLKIGISLNPKYRARSIQRELDGAFVDIARCIHGDSSVICDFEDFIHKKSNLKHVFIGKRFGGFTECYRVKDYHKIMQMLDEFVETTEGVKEL